MNEDVPESPIPVPIPYVQPRIQLGLIQLKSLKQARFEKKSQTSRIFCSVERSCESSPVKKKVPIAATSVISRAKRKVIEEQKKIANVPYRVINLVKTTRRSINF